MGAAMARALFDIERPTVGLLNIGVEEVKGLEEVREAGQLPARKPTFANLDYVGFVEGDDIGKGTVDVVVTEGFAGNIALKTAEGTAKQIAGYLRAAMSRTLLAPASAISWPRDAFDAAAATRWTRARSMAASSSASTASSSRATAAPTRRASPPPSRSATAWFATELIAKINQDLAAYHKTRGPHAATDSPRRKPIVSVLRSVVLGSGGYLPAKVLTNDDLSKMVDTSDEWIIQRTGIRERHIAADGELTSDLGAEAARRALADAGLTAADIDLIVVATATPDNTFPAAAVTVQEKLGMTHGAAFDVQAVCSGFVFGLDHRRRHDQDRPGEAGAGDRRRDLFAHPRLDRPLDLRALRRRRRRGGACRRAAAGERTDRGMLSAHLRSDGRYQDKLYVDGGPSSTGTVGHLRMEGREVFKHAVGMITDVIEDAFRRDRLHRRGHRLVRAASGQYPDHRRDREEARHPDREGDPHRRSSRQHLGRLDSAGAVGGRAATAASSGATSLLLEAMGGGFTWGAVLLRW